MRDILTLCIELDTQAERLYRSVAQTIASDALRPVFRALADEEHMHVSWWTELLQAWESGLLPDIVDDPGSLLERLALIRREVESVQSSLPSPSDIDGALALAARIEFFMLDPVFGELLDLMEPARSLDRRTAYNHHIEQLIGAIGRFTDQHSLVATLAKVLERTLASNRALTSSATKDPLTGLRNRRALDTHLPQWLAWAARYGRPITVALIDVDGMKSVNDTYGHQAGDRVLRTVAASIQASIRASDIGLRYGGDEFMIVAPEAGVAEYEALAARLLDAVRAARVDHDGGPIPVRVTVGGAVALDSAGSRPRSTDEITAAADSSLYEAKRAGRDRAGAPIMLEPR